MKNHPKTNCRKQRFFFSALSALKSQKGGAIIEMAITLPMLILFCFIFIEMGIAFIDRTVIDSAARAAAREIARGSANSEQAANLVLKSLIPWFNGNAKTCNTGNIVCTANTNSYTITYEFRYFLLTPLLNLTNNGEVAKKIMISEIEFTDLEG